MSVFAIGDIHGCPDELEVLLSALAPTSGDTVVFLGDYVDRGPASRLVVDRLLRLPDQGFASVFLRGNHEDMLLAYLGVSGRHGDVYLENGGGATLASYGIPPGTPRPAVRRLFPDAHIDFFRACVLHHVVAPFLFVHAGIRPGIALAQQEEEDFLWIREEFFAQPHALPYTVVFGHTPTREARVELPYRIGLDTGLVYGNKLSCLDVDSQRLVQVARGARRPTTRDLSPAFAKAGL
jgi:calcineurin-like phosphoesterase family protein